MRPDAGDGSKGIVVEEPKQEFPPYGDTEISVCIIFSSISQQSFAGWMDDHSVETLKSYKVEYSAPNLVWECPASQAYTKDYDETFFIDCSSENDAHFDDSTEHDEELIAFMSNALNRLKYYITQLHREGVTGLCKVDIFTFHPCEKLMFGLSNLFNHSLPEQDVYSSFISLITSKPEYSLVLNWFLAYSWQIQVDYCCVFEAYRAQVNDKGVEQRLKEMENLQWEISGEDGRFSHLTRGQEDHERIKEWTNKKGHGIIYGKANTHKDWFGRTTFNPYDGYTVWDGEGEAPEEYNVILYKVQYEGKWYTSKELGEKIKKTKEGPSSAEIEAQCNALEDNLKRTTQQLQGQVDEIDAKIEELNRKQYPGTHENQVFHEIRQKETEEYKKRSYQSSQLSDEEIGKRIEEEHIQEREDQIYYHGEFLTKAELEKRRKNIYNYLIGQREELDNLKKLQAKKKRQEDGQTISNVFTGIQIFVAIASIAFPPLCVVDVFMTVFQWYAKDISGELETQDAVLGGIGIGMDFLSIIPVLGGVSKLTRIATEAEMNAAKNFRLAAEASSDLQKVAKEAIVTTAETGEAFNKAGKAVGALRDGIKTQEQIAGKLTRAAGDAAELQAKANQIMADLNRAATLKNYEGAIIEGVGSNIYGATSNAAKASKAGGEMGETLLKGAGEVDEFGKVTVKMRTPSGTKMVRMDPSDAEALVRKQTGLKKPKLPDVDADLYAKLANDKSIVAGLEGEKAGADAAVFKLKEAVDSSFDNWRNLFEKGEQLRGPLTEQLAKYDGIIEALNQSTKETIKLENKATLQSLATDYFFPKIMEHYATFGTEVALKDVLTDTWTRIAIGVGFAGFVIANDDPRNLPDDEIVKEDLGKAKVSGSHDAVEQTGSDLYKPLSDEELYDLQTEASLDKSFAQRDGDQEAEWLADQTLADIDTIQKSRETIANAPNDMKEAAIKQGYGETNWGTALDDLNDAEKNLEEKQAIAAQINKWDEAERMAKARATQSTTTAPDYAAEQRFSELLGDLGYKPGTYLTPAQVVNDAQKNKATLQKELDTDGGLEAAQARYDFAADYEASLWDDYNAVATVQQNTTQAAANEQIATSRIRQRQKDSQSDDTQGDNSK